MAITDLSRASAALVVVLTALVAAGALYLAAPPAPTAASGAASEFSAERAMAHVDALAGSVRPLGSDAHADARAYLLGELRGLGLEPEVQTTWATSVRGSGALAARVNNILARVEGEADGPAVALMSHYDSVPTGPGAGDAAAGVAAIVETVRAVLAGGPLRNDLLVVITDGEEVGLLGARAFADEHPWMADIGLVLNFEARGNIGLVTMFETSDGNGRLARQLASAAPHPWASSLSYEVYRRMPNDTDLTVLRGAGAAGLNFAMIGHHAAYHTSLDTADALDRRSLQQMGSYALSLSRRFGSLDLGDLASSDAVYFNPVGSWLVVYAVTTGRVLAVVSLVVLAIIFVQGRRRELIDARGVRLGVVAAIGLPVLCALLLGALWNLVERIFPVVLAAPHGDPYAWSVILVAFLWVSLGMTAFVSGLVETADSASLLAGILAVWSVLTLTLSFLVPGASYLTLWPVVAGAATLGARLLPGGSSRHWATGLLIAVPLVTAAIFSPVVRLVAEALSVTAAPVQGLVLGLPLALLLPWLKVITRGGLLVSVVCTAVGLALLGWVGWSAGPTSQTPGLTSLYYALDTDKGEAFWVSYETQVSDWTAQVIPAVTEPGPVPDFLPSRPGRSVLSTTAPVVDLPAPSAELVSDVFEDGVRILTLNVRSVRGAPWMTLVPDPSMATIDAMSVAGRLVEVDEGAGPVTLTLQNVPTEGVEVSFRTIDRQPMKIGVLDVSFGFPELDGLSIEPRPTHLIRALRWWSDTTSVHRAVWF